MILIELKTVQDQAKALMALYNNTRMIAPVARMLGQVSPTDMTLEEATTIIQAAKDKGRGFYFDYVKGRMIKSDLKEYPDFVLFDRDHGPGAGEWVVLDALTTPGT